MIDPFPYEGRGDHFFCRFPHGSQLGEALNFLHAHKDSVAFVTDPVADVESAFSVTDTTLVNGTPLDVLRECQWTWICAPPPLGPDIHVNAAGYGVIAQAFAAALP
jgi:hypothetical protein